MTEKWVTIYVDDYPRRCKESNIETVLQNIEQLKQRYLKAGVPKEVLEKMYTVRIVKDEH